jgi:ATP-dependent protease ClpP protease subunit
MEYVINLKDEINKSTADFVEMEANKALAEKYTSLTLIINSFGGSVYDGMSIVSALKNTGLPTKARIEGYCASMAAIIAMTCDRVEMAEHGILMFHNPYIEGIEEMSASEKQAMELTTNSLITLASRKVPRKFLKKIMEKETWIDSSQAELMGMIDEVYDINLLDELNLSSVFNKAFVNKNQDLLNSVYNKLKNTMEKTKNLNEKITTEAGIESIEDKMLGLESGEESSLEIESPVDEVDYKTMYEELMKKFEEMQSSMGSMKNQIELFEKNESKVRLDKAIERVEIAINEGRIDETAKGEWVETLQNNYDLGVKMINTIKVSTKAPELPFMNKTKVKDVKDNWTIRDYEEKDPTGLKNILINNKPLYKQLFEDFYGVEYKG